MCVEKIKPALIPKRSVEDVKRISEISTAVRQAERANKICHEITKPDVNSIYAKNIGSENVMTTNQAMGSSHFKFEGTFLCRIKHKWKIKIHTTQAIGTFWRADFENKLKPKHKLPQTSMDVA